MSDTRPHYEAAWKALQDAHDACFNHPDRSVLGLSCGPFSGVNKALGIIDTLERENARLKKQYEDAVLAIRDLSIAEANARTEVERLKAENARIISWLRRNANAEPHPLVRQALIEAHNAALGEPKG